MPVRPAEVTAVQRRNRGRYTLRWPADLLAERFGLLQTPGLRPRFNIAPSQLIPVIGTKAGGHGRGLAMFKWGFIPHWAQDDSGMKPVNARADTVAMTPMFSESFRLRRCIIPVPATPPFGTFSPTTIRTYQLIPFSPVADMTSLRLAILLAFLGFGSATAVQAADPPKPVKVFVLAGQSNMEGQAVADLEGKDYNDGKGTLKALLNDPAKAPLVKHLRTEKGAWTVRDDVWVRYQREKQPLLAGPLTVGFTVYGDKHHFGPELQFGHVVGDHFTNQVLLIKTAWGGKSLYKDFRPPSSGGEVGPYYTKMIAEIRDALANLKTDFPRYADQGYELAGFVWYHGWNDGVDPKKAVPEYEQNLVNLIKDVRTEFKVPNLPVIVGELTGPWVDAPGEWGTLRKAQAAAAARPEFKGNVLFVETHDFVRPAKESPNPGHGHHEFGNAETYFLVGDGLGKGMVKLLTSQPKGKPEPSK